MKPCAHSNWHVELAVIELCGAKHAVTLGGNAFAISSSVHDAATGATTGGFDEVVFTHRGTIATPPVEGQMMLADPLVVP